MRIIIFTSNAVRHKYVANELAKKGDEVLVVVESKPSDVPNATEKERTPIENNFYERYLTEQKFFAGNDIITAPTLPLLYKEANLDSTYEEVKRFRPDAGFVFGASLLKDNLISLLPPGKFVNLHLGLSPYYRGSGTNFWPFVNEELEYVGATILHLDPGIDTGDIIAHVRPTIELGDNVHTVGCKTIKTGAACMVACLEKLKKGEPLKRIKQWEEPNSKYYRSTDFNERILNEYLSKLANGLVEKHLGKTPHRLRLVEF